MRRAALVVTLVLVSAPALAQRSEEEAGDVSEVDKDASGPLRERIRPVSGHRFLMAERFEVSPALGLSIRDAFFTKVLFGAAFTYHFSEAFSASLRAAYALSLIAGSAQICDPPGTANPTCRLPTREELTLADDGSPQNKAYGLITFLGSADFQWSPIYGKLALFAQSVLYFNMYALAGPTVVLYGPSTTPTVGGNVGLGFRFALNEWIAVRLELRDTIYVEQGYRIGGYTQEGTPVPADPAPVSTRNQLSFELGLSMFFPTLFSER